MNFTFLKESKDMNELSVAVGNLLCCIRLDPPNFVVSQLLIKIFIKKKDN